ncbi:MAG TPA: hypothetical protein VFB12_09465 [Ktedonobacteraceae bacterium]|nr:hypothetical protein [Ktedonobacteraceae bacterium]
MVFVKHDSPPGRDAAKVLFVTLVTVVMAFVMVLLLLIGRKGDL